ncbi:MAG: zinc ribbon domain-containing protein [Candidatus Lokiarchaeota archaeon]|nr:zinc ribbon domain-containing protein [Candidatus Lokiarchaeota archaeon]
MSKFCTNCGKPLEKGKKVCANCGTPLVKDTVDKIEVKGVDSPVSKKNEISSYF